MVRRLEAAASPGNPAAFHERGPLTTGPLTTGPLTTGPLTLPSPRRGEGGDQEPRRPTPGFSAVRARPIGAAVVSSFWSCGITSPANRRRLRSASSYGMPA
jgi:hypothetical protein